MSVDDASAALSAIRYTLLVLGTRGPAGPHFMVANWGTQASFDPWRYVVCVKSSARTLGYLKEREAFTVNLLAPAEAATVREILKRRGEGLDADPGPTEAPRLRRAFAGFDCEVVEVHDVGGDHVVVVGEPLDGWKRAAEKALTLGELDLSYAG